MSDVSPSKVRSRVLQEYGALRHTLDELDGMVGQLLSVGLPAVDQTLIVTAKLVRELSDYVELEQLFVLPTVRRVDIWGSIRADALAKAHETRRDDLDAIDHAHHGPVDPQLFATDLREFVQELRSLLEREERDVLGVNGLRDDVIETEPD